jgi:hypothetical protein
MPVKSSSNPSKTFSKIDATTQTGPSVGVRDGQRESDDTKVIGEGIEPKRS